MCSFTAVHTANYKTCACVRARVFMYVNTRVNPHVKGPVSLLKRPAIFLHVANTCDDLTYYRIVRELTNLSGRYARGESYRSRRVSAEKERLSDGGVSFSRDNVELSSYLPTDTLGGGGGGDVWRMVFGARPPPRRRDRKNHTPSKTSSSRTTRVFFFVSGRDARHDDGTTCQTRKTPCVGWVRQIFAFRTRPTCRVRRNVKTRRTRIIIYRDHRRCFHTLLGPFTSLPDRPLGKNRRFFR